MSPAFPVPPGPEEDAPKTKTAPSEEDLDRVLARIDDCLPRIHQKAKTQRLRCVNGRKNGSHKPTRPLPVKDFKRTQAVFRAMSKESLLTESGDDIRLDDE